MADSDWFSFGTAEDVEDKAKQKAEAQIKAVPPPEDPYQKQFAESQAGVLSSAAGQLAATQKGAELAQAGLGELEKQQQGALGAVRSRAGQAFAAQQAQGGGGALAGMRQSQLSRGVAEGQLMGDFGMQKIAQQRMAAQAQKEAAQAAGEYATTQQKLKQQEAERTKAQLEEQSGVEQEIANMWQSAVDAQGAFGWWSDKDAKRTADAVRAKYANYPNPKIKMRAYELANDIEHKAGNFSE